MIGLYKAYRFFKENGGRIVGHCAEGALSLARAEQESKRRGWFVEWNHDEDHDSGPRDWGGSEKECKAWEATHHECLWARLCDERGGTLASLGGIWDPSREDARVIEAELAAEALALETRERARTATRTRWEPVA